MSQLNAERDCTPRFVGKLNTTSDNFALWWNVFESENVPLLDKGALHTPKTAYYQIDISALTPEQRERLVEQQARLHKVSPAEVEEGLRQFPVPIPARDICRVERSA